MLVAFEGRLRFTCTLYSVQLLHASSCLLWWRWPTSWKSARGLIGRRVHGLCLEKFVRWVCARYYHARIRSYAESIAFWKAEEHERRNLDHTFDDVLAVEEQIIYKELPLDCKVLFSLL